MEVFSPRLTLSGSQHFGADMIHQTKFAVQNFEIIENAKVFLPQGIGFPESYFGALFRYIFEFISSLTSKLILDLHNFRYERH